MADLDAAGGADTVALIERGGGCGFFVAVDVGREASVALLFEAVLAGAAGLDILVNNAAIDLEVGEEAGAWRSETMDRVWRVNVMGAFHCMRRALPVMEARRRGAVVNVASTAGLTGVRGKPAYTAAKHALVGLTRVAAIQYGPAGVRVNALCPSAIRTDMLAIQGIDEAALIANHPLGRIADPGDIADAAFWLCSDQSRHITGHPLVIDGGRSAY
ncbi:NAD(P)-dependent dehydrogenase (short-subunit alcohol dehydrogenase family) [Sphingosinicella soli]|uniref:NAD(P)-dependent dehydrogenase (Short-subunit alcohol dehydrogenase family) n=1 Tax=Sphingosinicella soli TaxID=333708 RepID=A0A7W7B2A8_9SPHN|nr:NAD(P)-dependent dehydrogenase (short-subunit alcohol dehydrogenase family) [Sphingosinicella soli]